MRWLFILVLAVAGCAKPSPAPPSNVPLAPTLSGVYTPAAAPVTVTVHVSMVPGP